MTRPKTSKTRKPSTKDRMVTVGRSLLQRHGYNGFSFQHIADDLGVQKASLYDHYANKEALVIAILENYQTAFHRLTEELRESKPTDNILQVFGVFHQFVSDHRKICPVLALAVDPQALTKNILKVMNTFVGTWLEWLEREIKKGQRSGHIRKDLPAKDLTLFVYSQGMGSQFQARMNNDPDIPLEAGKILIRFLSPNI